MRLDSATVVLDVVNEDNAATAAVHVVNQYSPRRDACPISSYLGYLAKTPVDGILTSLEECFPSRNVSVTRLSSVGKLSPGGDSLLKCYLMDCILD
jgi:hypothetical protein